MNGAQMSKAGGLATKWAIDFSVKGTLERGTSTEAYLGCNPDTQKLIAVKIQRWCGTPRVKGCKLCHERQVYKILGPSPHIPLIYDLRPDIVCGSKECDIQCLLAMELLGLSLHQVMHAKLGRPRLSGSGLFFSLEEVANIGIQMISALEFVHSNGFVHRDIRPKHILYDLATSRLVLTGYGIVQRYRDTATLRHVPLLSPGMVGSPIFTSVNSHHGHTLSRRDDMESLGYVLVYLFRGSLPWQSSLVNTSDEIFTKKSTIRSQQLCMGLHPLGKYLRAVKRLPFSQSPDYDSLRRMLQYLNSLAS